MIIVVFLQIDVPQSLASCTYTCTLGYLNALLSALGEHWLSASLGPVITAKNISLGSNTLDCSHQIVSLCPNT